VTGAVDWAAIDATEKRATNAKFLLAMWDSLT
jgi:hypothetical protein